MFGTTTLLAALDFVFVIGKCHKRHQATEFLAILKQLPSSKCAGALA